MKIPGVERAAATVAVHNPKHLDCIYEIINNATKVELTLELCKLNLEYEKELANPAPDFSMRQNYRIRMFSKAREILTALKGESNE